MTPRSSRAGASSSDASAGVASSTAVAAPARPSALARSGRRPAPPPRRRGRSSRGRSRPPSDRWRRSGPPPPDGPRGCGRARCRSSRRPRRRRWHTYACSLHIYTQRAALRKRHLMAGSRTHWNPLGEAGPLAPRRSTRIASSAAASSSCRRDTGAGEYGEAVPLGGEEARQGRGRSRRRRSPDRAPAPREGDRWRHEPPPSPDRGARRARWCRSPPSRSADSPRGPPGWVAPWMSALNHARIASAPAAGGASASGDRARSRALRTGPAPRRTAAPCLRTWRRGSPGSPPGRRRGPGRSSPRSHASRRAPSRDRALRRRRTRGGEP